MNTYPHQHHHQPYPSATPVQYERNTPMYVLHAVGLAIEVFYLLNFLKNLGELVEALSYWDVPSSTVNLIIAGCLGQYIYWICWCVAALIIKSYFLTGNQWVKCSPIIIYGALNVLLGLGLGSSNSNILVLAICALVYVHHVHTSWWKPFKIVEPYMVPAPGAAVMIQMPGQPAAMPPQYLYPQYPQTPVYTTQA